MWRVVSYGSGFIAPILLVIFGEQLQGLRMRRVQLPGKTLGERQ